MSTLVEQQHQPAWQRFFRNPRTHDVVVVQWPNVALWLFIVASAVHRLLLPRGTLGTGLSVVADISLALWALLEIARGESPFRRVLGALVLIGSALGYFVGR